MLCRHHLRTSACARPISSSTSSSVPICSSRVFVSPRVLTKTPLHHGCQPPPPRPATWTILRHNGPNHLGLR